MTENSLIPDVLVGGQVVVDTDSQYIYIGRLTGVDHHFMKIEDVDVHDVSDSKTSKEIYIMDARKFGIKRNRKTAFVLSRHVISLSPLEDVIEY